MKTFGRIVFRTVVTFLALMGIIFVSLVVYYYPVIDRLYVRPCHYYPNAFSDCQAKE